MEPGDGCRGFEGSVSAAPRRCAGPIRESAATAAGTDGPSSVSRCLPPREFTLPRARMTIDVTVDGALYVDAGTIWEGDALQRGRARGRWGAGARLTFHHAAGSRLRLDLATDGSRVRTHKTMVVVVVFFFFFSLLKTQRMLLPPPMRCAASFRHESLPRAGRPVYDGLALAVDGTHPAFEGRHIKSGFGSTGSERVIRLVSAAGAVADSPVPRTRFAGNPAWLAKDLPQSPAEPAGKAR